jgi:hypothetical protein
MSTSKALKPVNVTSYGKSDFAAMIKDVLKILGNCPVLSQLLQNVIRNIVQEGGLTTVEKGMQSCKQTGVLCPGAKECGLPPEVNGENVN